MRNSIDVKPRKVTPPSPSYMTNDQFANYLSNLRSNRTARPGGARPHPTSAFPAPSRTSLGRYSLDAASQAASLYGDQRTTSPSHAPSIAGASVSSHYSARSARSRDYHHEPPTAPLKPSDVVPTATYMERGHRWMEKEEVFALRDAMEEMSLRQQPEEPQETDEETRLYNAALDEASELVWQHQHGVPPPQPDGPYRYRPHLRKNSYGHARAASLSRRSHEFGPCDFPQEPGYRSVSGSSSEGDQVLESKKSYGSIGPASSGRVPRRRSSMRRNISGEVERPFSGDQIWEEPEGSPANSPVKPQVVSQEKLSLNGSTPANRLPPLSSGKYFSKQYDRVEIYRNPPARSRDPRYTTNSTIHRPESAGEKEIRSQDIREATSLRLRDRSSKLPEPTAVSDSPGRPIVSFDTNWRAPDETTDISLDRQDQAAASGRRQARQPRPLGVPSIQVSEEGPALQRQSPTSADVPSISVAAPNDMPRAPPPTINVPTINIPDINVPGIAVEDASSSLPSICTEDTNKDTNSTRPLPTPGVRGSRPFKAREPRSHWSPAPGVSTRITAQCHECGFPIEGRFVALAGSKQRFHPQCFSCFACGTSLEAMEISPEPDSVRNERLERLRRREAGEVLAEEPGMTAEEDGDDRLRFFCHLDWHELFAPRCNHCKTPILGEHVVALGHHWHNGHFFCAECGDPFEHGMTHIEKDGYAWCINCQTKRTQRGAPKCKMCKQPVIGEYIQALGGEWHEQCFRCAECRGGFDDGQIFPKEVQGVFVVLCTECRTKELKL